MKWSLFKAMCDSKKAKGFYMIVLIYIPNTQVRTTKKDLYSKSTEKWSICRLVRVGIDELLRIVLVYSLLYQH